MRRVVLVLGTAVAAIGVGLALGELLVRLALGPPARILYTGSFRDAQTDFDVVYGVTPEGLRRTCGPAPDANGPRIAVLGDSFVFGQGVRDCEDFVSLLNLRSRDERFLNFGIIGGEIADYPIVARDLLADTDGVVVAFFGNDVEGRGRSVLGRLADLSSAFGLIRRARRAWTLYRIREADRDGGGTIAFFEGRPNNVLSVLRESADGMRRMAEPSPDEIADFRTRFARLAEDLLRRFGPERVWITCVPDGQTVSPSFAEFIRQQGGSVAPFGAPGPAYELVRELSREHGLRFVDVFPGFLPDGDALYHPHDLHWTPAGQRRMAELLAGPLGLDAAGAPGAQAAPAPVVPSAAP